MFGSEGSWPASGYIDAAFGGLVLVSIDDISVGWGLADTKSGSSVGTHVVYEVGGEAVARVASGEEDGGTGVPSVSCYGSCVD